MNVKPQPRQRPHNLLLSLLFVLALLISLYFFMFLFAQLALSEKKQEWLEVSVLTKLRAEYRPGEWETLAGVIEQTARDERNQRATLEPIEPQTDSPQFMPVYEWRSGGELRVTLWHLEPIEPQTDSPQFMPVYEWPSD